MEAEKRPQVEYERSLVGTALTAVYVAWLLGVPLLTGAVFRLRGLARNRELCASQPWVYTSLNFLLEPNVLMHAASTETYFICIVVFFRAASAASLIIALSCPSLSSWALPTGAWLYAAFEASTILLADWALLENTGAPSPPVFYWIEPDASKKETFLKLSVWSVALANVFALLLLAFAALYHIESTRHLVLPFTPLEDGVRDRVEDGVRGEIGEAERVQ